MNKGQKSKVASAFGLNKNNKEREIEFQLNIEDLEVIDEVEERKTEHHHVSKIQTISEKDKKVI